MNVASLELCKELYELSGWDGTHIFYDAENDPVESRAALLMHPTKNCPAYDLGYLLRRLPQNTEVYDDGRHFSIGKYDTDTNNWDAGYAFGVHATAETPEDAAAKLCIELFKQNVLTKEIQSS